MLFLNSAIAVKFCASRHYACVDDAVAICSASGTKYCTNVINGMTWQYSVDGVSGCHEFQSGNDSGKSCYSVENKDCFPLHRNYCDCKVCTNDADCDGIKNAKGQAAGCEDAVNMTNTSYFKGFAAAKQCGIDNCANALKAAYGQLNTC
jgi:hypothetical protein